MKWPLRIGLLIICAFLAGLALFQMDRLPLWVWYPFLFLTGTWAFLLLLLGKIWTRHRKNTSFLLLTTLSGILMSLGFPPSPLNFLLLLGLVPLLFVEHRISQSREGASNWEVFKYAYNTFFIYNALTTWWVLNTSFLPGIFAIVVNAGFMAMVFMLFHWAGKYLKSRLKYLALISFWISFEWIHTQWELSWPWLTLGNALAQFPQAIQWYSFTGPFGGSLWVLVLNILCFHILLARVDKGVWSKKDLRQFLLIFMLPLLFSFYTYWTYPLAEGEVEVAVVQPNFEPHHEKFRVPGSQQLLRFLSIADTLVTDSTDYLVFPETSFSFIHLNEIDGDPYVKAVKAIIDQHPNLRVVLGVTSYRTFSDPPLALESLRMNTNRGDTSYYDVQNAALEVSSGDEVPYYFKSKLVPGAESFPFSSYLPFLRPLVDMLEGSTEGLTRQKERAVFEGPLADVAPIICYESIYGSYVRGYLAKGADLLFIITNDGWWDKTPGHIQHLKLGALLAIEHRRQIARSANSGISCFINERGDILQATNYDEATGIKRKLDPGEGISFYTRWGDMVARLSLFLSLMLIALFITRRIVPGR